MTETDPAQAEIADLEAELEIERELSKRMLENYSPYKKQMSFHTMGRTKRERAFLAGNQLGKSLAGGAEFAMHLTGLYPNGWNGKRFDHPVAAWAAGNSNETTRDNPQRILMGPVGEWGTGMIPARCIGAIKRSKGIADFIDIVKVKHVTGGWSWVRFKAYEQGRDKWQGATLCLVWYDEEPPPDIYAEGITRCNHGDRGKGGISFITATPLMGMTEVMRQFYPQPNSDSRGLVQMEIKDVDHYSDERKAEIIAQYPPHEREARAKGIPTLGSGRVYQVEESHIMVDPFDIPKHWTRVIGSDFGWDHPTAFVDAAIDRDNDTLYITNVYKRAEAPIELHAAAISAWGAWKPVAWPHDGHEHEKGSGQTIAEQYRANGLNMMLEHATHATGGISTEGAIMGIFGDMLKGKFKVFSNLGIWWDEFRTYHRKDGQIVKKFDDLMSATHKAWMMKRFARTHVKRSFAPTVEAYDPLSPAAYGVTH